MTTQPFQIGAPGFDVEKIVAEVRQSVAAKREAGAYTDVRIARAERYNLHNMKDDETFMEFYLDCLREAVYVDINDFEIRERRALGAPLLVAMKRAIWSLLRFYTYRLWSQQNQINGLLLSAIEEWDRKYRGRIQDLEHRLKQAETRLAQKHGQS